MKNNRIVLKSLVIAAIYFTTSCIYLFGGFHIPLGENAFSETIDLILSLPALIIFGVAFTSGGLWTYLAGLIVFLVLWAIMLWFTYIYYSVKGEKQNRKPNPE